MTRKALISPGYGAGWSTWADRDQREAALFDPELIADIEAATTVAEKYRAAERFVARHGFKDFYVGGARDLVVQEIEGEFKVEEYDGFESVLTRDDDTDWI